jgi:hypothetical protein
MSNEDLKTLSSIQGHLVNGVAVPMQCSSKEVVWRKTKSTRNKRREIKEERKLFPLLLPPSPRTFFCGLTRQRQQQWR